MGLQILTISTFLPPKKKNVLLVFEKLRPSNDKRGIVRSRDPLCHARKKMGQTQDAEFLKIGNKQLKNSPKRFLWT